MLKKNNHLNKTFLWCSSQDLQGYQIALFGRSAPEFLQYAYSSWKTMKAVVSLAKGDLGFAGQFRPSRCIRSQATLATNEHPNPAKDLWMNDTV